jgi:hypothetical protein
MRRNVKLWGIALVAAFLAACGGPDPFSIEIVSDDRCNGLDIIEPSHAVVLTVRGPGMSPIVVETDGDAGRLEVPDIPEGKDRVISVEVWTASGDRKIELVARGESKPFEVTADGAPSVRVVLYRTNFFSKVVGPTGSCSSMTQARGGHVAAPLSEHKVLIAGGYSGLQEDGLTPDGILDSAEIFDLRSGTFERAPSMPRPRALARAVALSGGRVLVVGGVMEEGGAFVAQSDAFLFDGKSWKTIPTAAARRGHTVTFVEGTGDVLVVGGVDDEDQIVSTVEVFDPDTETFSVLDLGDDAGTFARAYHGAANAGRGNDSVVIVGGIDGEGQLTGLVARLQWDNLQKTYIVPAQSYQLETPVMMPATMVLGSAAGPRLVVAGGAAAYAAPPGMPGAGTPSEESREVQFYEPLSGSSRGTTNLGGEVMEACGVTLDNSRGLVLGGWKRNIGALAMGDLVRLASGSISVSKAGESTGTMQARKHLACTPIGKNGVLVTGGFDQSAKATDWAAVYFMKPDANG